jgi:hypothetical protein
VPIGAARDDLTRLIHTAPSKFFHRRIRRVDARVGARQQRAVAADLLGAFGAFGLLLAAIGVFSGIHQAATERLRELAIRIALGAEPHSIRYLVVRRILMLSSLAIAVEAGPACSEPRSTQRALRTDAERSPDAASVGMDRRHRCDHGRVESIESRSGRRSNCAAA